MNDNVLQLHDSNTLMIFLNGTVVHQFAGVQSEGSLLAALEQAVN